MEVPHCCTNVFELLFPDNQKNTTVGSMAFMFRQLVVITKSALIKRQDMFVLLSLIATMSARRKAAGAKLQNKQQKDPQRESPYPEGSQTIVE